MWIYHSLARCFITFIHEAIGQKRNIKVKWINNNISMILVKLTGSNVKARQNSNISLYITHNFAIPPIK